MIESAAGKKGYRPKHGTCINYTKAQIEAYAQERGLFVSEHAGEALLVSKEDDLDLDKEDE